MTLEETKALAEECKRVDSAFVGDPDVVLALVRVALAAKAVEPNLSRIFWPDHVTPRITEEQAAEFRAALEALR